MLSPVFGLRPVRALRVETANVPNPEMLTLSPFRSAPTMSSNTMFTARSACPFGRSSLAATDSIKSALVIAYPLSRARPIWHATWGLSMCDDVGVGLRRRLERRRCDRLRRGRLDRLPQIGLGILEHERLPQDVIHVLDELDRDRFQDDRRNLLNVLLVLERNQHTLDPATVCRQDLLLEAADR